MGRVRRTDLPRQSALWTLRAPGDFLDCYATPTSLPPREAAARALTMPHWARALLRLRNRLVAPLGLRTGAGPGDRTIGIFPVLSETADEIILGMDDRHLDFRIAILRDQGRVHAATWVQCHNALGRAYLRLVMPFHILIMRNAVGRLATP